MLTIILYLTLNALYFIQGGELDWEYISVTIFGVIFLYLEIKSLSIRFNHINPKKERVFDLWKNRNNYIPEKLGRAYIGATKEIEKLKSKLNDKIETENRIYYIRQLIRITTFIIAIWLFFEYHNFNKGLLPVTTAQVDSVKVEFNDSLKHLEVNLDKTNQDLKSIKKSLNKVDSQSEMISKIKQKIDSIELYILKD